MRMWCIMLLSTVSDQNRDIELLREMNILPYLAHAPE